jgi:hypothetical protein
MFWYMIVVMPSFIHESLSDAHRNASRSEVPKRATVHFPIDCSQKSGNDAEANERTVFEEIRLKGGYWNGTSYRNTGYISVAGW